MFATSAAPAGWAPVAARAAVALAAGLTVTFVSDHSAGFGLTVFGVFAAATAIVLAWGARTAATRLARSASWIAAAVSAAAAVAAFVGGGLTVLVAVLVAYGAVTGVLELVVAFRERPRGANFRDGLIVGILSLLLAAVAAVIPFDFTNAWETVAKDGTVVSGVVTAEVFVVGVFGAYAVVLGVFLAIAAVSMRAPAAAQETRETAQVSGER